MSIWIQVIFANSNSVDDVNGLTRIQVYKAFVLKIYRTVSEKNIYLEIELSFDLEILDMPQHTFCP